MKTIALATAAALVAASPALAESSPARDALKRFCTGDYMEHCSQYSPGGPEVEACFKANMRKLTPGCSQAIVAYKRERKANPSREAEAR